MPRPFPAPCYVEPVTARLVLASIGALATLGCADMLGLGGLTFDQAAAGGAPATGGAAVSGAGGSGGSAAGGGTTGAGGLTLGTGGSGIEENTGGSSPRLTDEYPLTWPTGATLVAEWRGFGPSTAAGTTFWLYDREASTLFTHRLRLEEPDELGSSLAPEGWDLLYAPTIDGSQWLFGYEAATGLVDFGPAPVPGELFAPDTQAGSAGWTHVLLAGDAAAPLLVAANRETGMVRIGPADPTLEDPIVSAITLDSPFTHLLPYRIGDTDGIVQLDSATGEAAFLPIVDGMLGEASALELGASPGWSLAATYNGGSGPSFVLYDASSGRVETYRPGGGGFNHEDSLWRLDLTAIVPLFGDGEQWAMTYDAETGVADLRALEPLYPSVVVK